MRWWNAEDLFDHAVSLDAAPERIAAYAALATPALTAAGGRILARDVAPRAYEAGVRGRSVIIEWDSVEQVVAFYVGVT